MPRAWVPRDPHVRQQREPTGTRPHTAHSSASETFHTPRPTKSPTTPTPTQIIPTKTQTTTPSFDVPSQKLHPAKHEPSFHVSNSRAKLQASQSNVWASKISLQDSQDVLKIQKIKLAVISPYRGGRRADLWKRSLNAERKWFPKS